MYIYADSNGKIVRILRSDQEIDNYGEPEAGTFDPANTVPIDFSENPIIDAALNDTPDEFTVESGVLKRNNTNVNIIDDSDGVRWRRAARPYVDEVRNGSVRSQAVSDRLDRLEDATALLLSAIIFNDA